MHCYLKISVRTVGLYRVSDAGRELPDKDGVPLRRHTYIPLCSLGFFGYIFKCTHMHKCVYEHLNCVFPHL